MNMINLSYSHFKKIKVKNNITEIMRSIIFRNVFMSIKSNINNNKIMIQLK